MPTNRPRPATGPRGLSREPMIRAAIELLESAGEAGFSIRKLGERLGCDPMAVLYHFKSREGLQRAMADWLTGQLTPVDTALPWQQRLQALAAAYRALALGHPKSFGLLQRYLSTGAADYRHIESVYRALRDAGIADREIPAISLGWYSTVYGLAMAEVGGLIRAATADDLAEAERLPAEGHELTRRVLPWFREVDPAGVASTTLDLLHHGIAARAGNRPP